MVTLWLHDAFLMLSLVIYIYINNSLHLAPKYARIFVRRHYLFLEAHSFPRAKLEENCELQGTNNVRGQISEHILAPNEGYCLYIYITRLNIKKASCNQCYHKHLQISCTLNLAAQMKAIVCFLMSSFSWGIFAHVTRLDQSRTSENI